MAYREIHDDVPLSRTLNLMSHLEERLYWRLLSQTDAWGRLSGEPRKIRLRAIPELVVTEEELDQALRRIHALKRIDVYLEAGVLVLQIVDFDERQHVARLKRAPSRFPARTASSTSPYDLPLSLPLLTDGPEACASTALLLPASEPEACDLPLSNSDKPARPARKRPAKSPIDREKTEREDRRESDLPTEGVVKPARESLSVAHAISESLDPGGRFELSEHDTPGRLDVLASDVEVRAAIGVPADDLFAIAGRLRGSDDGTPNVLSRLRRRGLPPAAFAAAMESLEERRLRQPPVGSEVRYVVGALNTMLREGTYGATA